MSIENLCNKDVVMISENASLQEAAKLMNKENVGSVVVVKDQKNDPSPVGMITDRDIVVKGVSQKTDLKESKVSEVMSKDLLLLKKSEGIKKAIKAMSDKNVRRAPVVDDNNKVLGVVSVDDFIRMIAGELIDLGKLVDQQVSD